MCKKELEELYAVCENSIFCVKFVSCCCRINVYTLCVVVLFIMYKLTQIGVTVQPKTNEVDELYERIILGGASIKESCSRVHTLTQNEMAIPSDNYIRNLVCFIMDLK